MLVSVPSLAAMLAAGMKNISVFTSSGGGPSGSSFQNVAVSVSNQSATTIQSSWRKAWRCRPAFIPPAAGFWPNMK